MNRGLSILKINALVKVLSSFYFDLNKMSKHFFYSLALLLVFSSRGNAQTADNIELKQMYESDQSSRMTGEIDWTAVNKMDSLRRIRVYELIKEGKLQTGKDYYHSAMIFQHCNDTIASAMAVQQMQKALTLDSTINRWLLAAAIDRDLMRRNQPQIYGTQFVKQGDAAKWERYKIDSNKVSDTERKYYSVETLAEQKQKEWLMNLEPLTDYYRKTASIAKTITLIKEQHQRGRLSAYSLEAEVNNFGYALLQRNKDKEALKIFKLNTELYPDGFNAFDSYGECLMKTGRTKEALQAYKQSLVLNPQNDNARKILETYQPFTKSDTMMLHINEQNTIFVKAVFNEQDTLDLNFDTGTTELVLTNETIDKKLHTKPKLYNTFYKLRISNRDYSTKVYDAQLTGHGTDGRFGWDLFRNNVVELNYDQQIMVVHPQLPAAVLNNKAYSKLAITYIEGLACILSTITQNGVSVTDTFLFDSGYQRTAMLDNDLLTARSFPAEKMKEIKRVVMKGAQGNEIPVLTAELQSLKIGNYELKNIPVQQIVSNKPLKGRNIHILGNEVLKRFNVFMDFKNNVIYLKPNGLYTASYIEAEK